MSLDQFVIDRRGGIAQGLLQIFLLEKRVLRKKRGAILVGRKELEDTPNCDPHASDARLAPALFRFHRNTVELLNYCHLIQFRRIGRLCGHFRLWDEPCALRAS